MDESSIINVTEQKKSNPVERNRINTIDNTHIQINNLNPSQNNLDNNIYENKKKSFNVKSEDEIVVQDSNIVHLTARLNELEAQITKEQNKLINTNTFKNMEKRANRMLSEGKEKKNKAIIKDSSTMTTIRCQELLNNTKNAIKLSLSQLSAGQLNDIQKKEIDRLLEKGSLINSYVGYKVAMINTYESHSEDEIKNRNIEINNLCTQLLSYSSWGNSTYFKNVVKAIKDFQKLPVEEKTAAATDALYAALNTYIQIRSKGKTKKNYKWPSGAKRVKLAESLQKALKSNYIIGNDMFSTKVQASADEIKKLSIDKIQANINERANKMATALHPEFYRDDKLAKELYGEFCHLIITKDMLARDYVMGHKKKFQHYINLINTCKENLDADKDTYDKRSEAYKIYRNQAQLLFKQYQALEDYVKLCINDKISDDEVAHAFYDIQSWTHMPENMSTAIAYFDYHMEQKKCYGIILDDINKLAKDKTNNLTKKEISSDVNRFSALIKPWKINEAGAPASDKDMAIYKENLRLFSSMFFSDETEFLVALKETFERICSEYILQKKDMKINSWGNNWQLKVKSLIWLNIQNIFTIRNENAKKITSAFTQMFPELADKLSDFADFHSTLLFVSASYFTFNIGELTSTNSFNDALEIEKLEVEQDPDLLKLYTKAKGLYKYIEKKYGKIFK